MKRLIGIVFLFPFILNAQVILHAGDSQLKGTFGIETKLSHLSLSAGWRPICVNTIDTRQWFHSYSLAGTYYFINSYSESLYISSGYATAGTVKINDYTDTEPVPAFIILGGLRYFPVKVAPRFPKWIFFDIGAGVNFNKYSTEVVIEFLINFSIIR